MKVPWIEIGVLIIVILMGYQILSNAPKIQNDQMCYACWKMNWKGEIKGELSYSCESSYQSNQSFKNWCYENDPLFANCSDCSSPLVDQPYMLQPIFLILVIIIDIILACYNHEKEKKTITTKQ